VRTRRVATVSAVLFAVGLLSGCAQSASSEIGGVVVDADGAPQSRCSVVVEAVDAPPYPEVAQVTGKDGEFSWTLPAGTYDVVAHCGEPTGRQNVRVPSVEELRITVE
jgi:hypothetical protein